MKKITLLLCMIPFAFFAQNNVGIGTNSPKASAILDLESANKGLLIPRLKITDAATASPVTTPEKGLLVWNNFSAIANGNGVGFYFWDGSQWQMLGLDIEVDPKIATTTNKIVPFWNGTQLVNGTIYDHGTDGITIGSTANPEAKVDATQSNSTKKGAVLGRGVFDTYGVLGAQIHSGDFNMALPSNLLGTEAGVLGASLGTPSTDNIGVFGYSNGFGGRFYHENGKSDIMLAGTNSAFEVKNSRPNATAVVDVSQDVSSIGYNGTTVWQIFEAKKTGILTAVETYIKSPLPTAVTFTLEVYKGQGVGGVLLGSTTLSVSSTTYGYQTFNLGNSIKVDVFSKYTFKISHAGPSNYFIHLENSNVYSDGFSNFGITKDLRFKTWVEQMYPPESSLIVLNTNVGVGTTTPTSKLDVKGDIKFTKALKPNGNAGSNNQVLVSTGSSTAPFWSSLSSVSGGIWAANGSNAVKSTGNVGIGTSTPTSKLQIDNGRVEITSNNNATGTQNTGALEIGNSLRLSKNDVITNTGTTLYLQKNNSGDLYVGNGYFFVDGSTGNVGVGTVTPTKGQLQVQGTVSTTIGAYGYLSQGGGTFTAPGTAPENVSIYANHRIACGAIAVFSDQRIKNIKGISNASADLNTLMKINITDYTMIDVVENGNKPYKKVIAQQVAKVYPQAVSSGLTDVVPDIYKKAEFKNGWVVLENDLKVGERVKIITEKDAEIYTVTEAIKSKFKVDSKLNTNDSKLLFVFGREVDDFHTVDYEAIAMLNVSATQAQQKLIEDLQKKNQVLEARLEATAQNTNQLKAEMADIKAMLGLQASAK